MFAISFPRLRKSQKAHLSLIVVTTGLAFGASYPANAADASSSIQSILRSRRFIELTHGKLKPQQFEQLQLILGNSGSSAENFAKAYAEHDATALKLLLQTSLARQADDRTVQELAAQFFSAQTGHELELIHFPQHGQPAHKESHSRVTLIKGGTAKSCCGHHHPKAPSTGAQIETIAGGTPEAALVESTLRDFHEAMEGGDHRHFSGARAFLRSLGQPETWKEWRAKFNFRKIGTRAYRMYQMKSASPAVREHAANLVFILPASHVFEMLSGPIGVAIASELGVGDAARVAIGTVGGIISIPGLDPVCILIMSAYPIPQFRNSITFMREGTTSALAFAGRVTGVKSLFSKLTTRKDGLQTMHEQILGGLADSDRWIYESESLSESEHSFKVSRPDETETFLELRVRATPKTFAADQAHVHVSKVIFPQGLPLPEQKSELKQALAPFHWNIRDAVTLAVEHARKAVAEPQGATHHDLFYVESVELGNATKGSTPVTVNFQPRSAPVPDRMSFAGWGKILGQ